MSKMNEPEFSAWLANKVQGDELCRAIDAVVVKQLDLTEVVQLVVARVVAAAEHETVLVCKQKAATIDEGEGG